MNRVMFSDLQPFANVLFDGKRKQNIKPSKPCEGVSINLLLFTLRKLAHEIYNNFF